MKNKKLITVILCLTMIFSLGTLSASAATKYTEGNLEYTVSKDGSITITGCFGNPSTLNVPSSIAGYPVNTIGSGAFADVEQSVTVNLPDTITTIKSGAFKSGVTVYTNVDTDKIIAQNSKSGSGSSNDSSSSSTSNDSGNSGVLISGGNSNNSSNSSNSNTSNSSGSSKITDGTKSDKKIVDENGNEVAVDENGMILEEEGELGSIFTSSGNVDESEADLADIEEEREDATTDSTNSTTHTVVIIVIVVVVIVAGVAAYFYFNKKKENQTEQGE